MTDKQVIGNRLISLRGKCTQDEIARDVGVTVSAIRMYEAGKRVPRDDVKVRLARRFNVSIEQLFFAD